MIFYNFNKFVEGCDLLLKILIFHRNCKIFLLGTVPTNLVILKEKILKMFKKQITNALNISFDRFYDKRDAEDALDAMDGRLLDGRELRVQMARYGRPTSPHRSRGSRRRGR